MLFKIFTNLFDKFIKAFYGKYYDHVTDDIIKFYII